MLTKRMMEIVRNVWARALVAKLEVSLSQGDLLAIVAIVIALVELTVVEGVTVPFKQIAKLLEGAGYTGTAHGWSIEELKAASNRIIPIDESERAAVCQSVLNEAQRLFQGEAPIDPTFAASVRSALPDLSG